MIVVINGETKNINDSINLFDLLKTLSLPTERVAIELNKEVIRKKDWQNISVNDGDKVEVIHFVGGG